MNQWIGKIGLIAGSGLLPIHVAHEAVQQGYRVLAIAFPGFTEPTIEGIVAETHWLRLGQLQKAISILKSSEIHRVVMVGKIEKSNLLRLWNIMPDWRALRVIRSLGDWRDDTVLAAIANEFAADGILVEEITSWGAKLMAPLGLLTGHPPTDAQARDIEFGRTMAKGIGALDIGQTVLVRNLAVIVVEAIEGTDKAIRRAVDLGIAHCVVVKMAKPAQDMRFDVPGIGPTTIDSMIAAKAEILAIEAGKTMITAIDEMLAKAREANISVLGIPSEGPLNLQSIPKT
jgi:UDP-2,3-diacylglucosamine hydrolase